MKVKELIETLAKFDGEIELAAEDDMGTFKVEHVNCYILDGDFKDFLLIDYHE